MEVRAFRGEEGGWIQATLNGPSADLFPQHPAGGKASPALDRRNSLVIDQNASLQTGATKIAEGGIDLGRKSDQSLLVQSAKGFKQKRCNSSSFLRGFQKVCSNTLASYCRLSNGPE